MALRSLFWLLPAAPPLLLLLFLEAVPLLVRAVAALFDVDPDDPVDPVDPADPVYPADPVNPVDAVGSVQVRPHAVQEKPQVVQESTS